MRTIIKIKEGETVEFTIANKERLTAKIIDGEIRIYCDGILHVIPWAANSIRLRVEN